MARQSRMTKKNKISQREEARINARRKESDENFATKFSRIMILIVFGAMVISLAYTMIAYLAFQ